jgi:large-conductance mechanosensitive channel
MNLNLAVHMKESVSPLIIEKMIIIIIILCTATFFFAVNFGAKAYAQENNINTNNNNTLLLEDMRALMREQQGDLSSIRNTSSAQFEALTQMSASFGKLQTQATYTALSVFFLGIGLVVFGLSLTTRSSPRIGRYLTLTIWSLVTPVIILVGLFQYGALSGNNPLAVFRSDPFIPLSFLMYIPIAIVVFLLLVQRKIMHAHAAQAAQAQAQASSQAKKDPYQELERLGSLKQQGLITEEEFQELKTRLLSGT